MLVQEREKMLLTINPWEKWRESPPNQYSSVITGVSVGEFPLVVPFVLG